MAATLISGCATTPVPQRIAGGEALAGRLTVKVDPTASTQARTVSAHFALQGTPEQGRFELSTPLGTMLAQAHWAPGKVALVTSQGERAFNSLDELTRELLGESLPVAALFDWLRGRPWASAPNTPTALPAEKGFQQLGWIVSLARFDEGLIAAKRDQVPAVTVRAKLDRQ